jgi:hypothetical protein
VTHRKLSVFLWAALFAACAQAQHSAPAEVERAALSFARAIYPGESVSSSPGGPKYEPHPRNSRPGYWECELYGDGVTISIRVSDLDRALLGLSSGGSEDRYPGNLNNFIKVPPFRPWYRASNEAFDRAREVARLVGAPVHDQVTEAEVQEPDSEGKVTSRKVFVKLEPVMNGYPSKSVNHTSIWLDAKTGLVSELSQIIRYRYELPKGTPISAGEATEAAQAVVGRLREPTTQGPQYMNVLDWRSGESWMSDRARSLQDSGAVPLVYVVYDRDWDVRVDACSGEVLQVMDSRGERAGRAETAPESEGPSKPGSWAGLFWFTGAGSALALIVYLLTRR